MLISKMTISPTYLVSLRLDEFDYDEEEFENKSHLSLVDIFIEQIIKEVYQSMSEKEADKLCFGSKDFYVFPTHAYRVIDENHDCIYEISIQYDVLIPAAKPIAYDYICGNLGEIKSKLLLNDFQSLFPNFTRLILQSELR